MHGSELLNTAFLGPYVPSAEKTGPRTQMVYPGLLHWFEAAKYMPMHPEIRDAVLCCPTHTEVRRFSRKRQALWRSDWPLVRHRVLVTGMSFLAMQRPELPLMTILAEELLEQLEELRLPVGFLRLCVEQFVQWRSSVRVAVLGSAGAPPDVVGRRIGRLSQEMHQWILLTPCSPRTHWLVHDWALAHFISTRYVGHPTDRLNRKSTEELILLSDVVLVFEQRKARAQDWAIQFAKRLSKKVLLELYDPPLVEQM